MNTKMYNELVKRMLDAFGNQVISIFLYGSVARGTNTDESDIDIAVIVKNHNPQMDEEKIDIVVDLNLEYDVVLSVLLIDEKDFREWENILPFYKNVKKDGIILWNAA